MKTEAVTDRIILLVSQILFTAIIVAVLVAVMMAATGGGKTDMSSFEQNVLTSIATATVLNMKEVITTTLALAAGKNVAALGTQLGNTAPPPNPLDADGKPAPIPVVVQNAEAEPVPVAQQAEQQPPEQPVPVVPQQEN